MNLSLLDDTMTIIKLDPSQPIPGWCLDNKTFVSITYTNDELSIVCPTDTIPSDIHSVGLNLGWKCIKVEGPLDFSLTGILSKLALPLAEAKISIFAISTFDTDYLMVKEDTLDEAIHVLTEDGHSFKQTL